jgi:hypothetical protein
MRYICFSFMLFLYWVKTYHSFIIIIIIITHSLTYLLSYLITYSLTYLLTHSLTHSLTYLIIYLLQLSCHSVAVVLTLVQTKQTRINVHK